MGAPLCEQDDGSLDDQPPTATLLWFFCLVFKCSWQGRNNCCMRVQMPAIRQAESVATSRKSPAEPGFRLLDLAESVSREDRGRHTPPVELVVQAGAKDVIPLAVREREAAPRRRIEEGASGPPKVGVEILNLGREITREGVFDTGTGGITQPYIAAGAEVREQRRRASSIGPEYRVRPAGITVGETTCAIDEEAVERDAGAGARGAEKSDAAAAVVAEAAETVVVATAKRLTVGLNTKDELVDLPVKSGLPAANEVDVVAVVVGAKEAGDERGGAP